jgi:hypothetical protein
MSAATTQTGGRKDGFKQRGRKDLKEGSRFFYQALSPFKSYGLLIVFWTTSLFFVTSVVLTLNFAHFREDSSRAKAALPRRHADTIAICGCGYAAL